MRLRRPLIAATALAILATLIVVGLSQAPTTNTNPRATTFTIAGARRALAGAPAPLAALHAQSALLLGGDAPAVRARLASLRGHPVFVNKWASWCGPCRAEFPLLQHAGVSFGRRIAFLGLNSGDNAGDARRFLRRFPVPYPSYSDPRERAAAALKASTAYPISIFLDARGRQVALHQGGYPTQAALDADIRRYLLPGA